MEKQKYVFNVLIGGVSIGLTFNRNEAANWIAQSMYKGSKEIIAVPYRIERPS